MKNLIQLFAVLAAMLFTTESFSQCTFFRVDSAQECTLKIACDSIDSDNIRKTFDLSSLTYDTADWMLTINDGRIFPTRFQTSSQAEVDSFYNVVDSLYNLCDVRLSVDDVVTNDVTLVLCDNGAANQEFLRVYRFDADGNYLGVTDTDFNGNAYTVAGSGVICP